MGETRWHPDTCDCILTHNEKGEFIRRDAVCSRHHNLDGKGTFDMVLSENRSKNQAVGQLMKEIPDLKVDDIAFTVTDEKTTVIIPQAKLDELAGKGKSGMFSAQPKIALLGRKDG